MSLNQEVFLSLSQSRNISHKELQRTANAEFNMSLFHSHKMRLLDLNVLLQAEMTDLPTFSNT